MVEVKAAGSDSDFAADHAAPPTSDAAANGDGGTLAYIPDADQNLSFRIQSNDVTKSRNGNGHISRVNGKLGHIVTEITRLLRESHLLDAATESPNAIFQRIESEAATIVVPENANEAALQDELLKKAFGTHPEQLAYIRALLANELVHHTVLKHLVSEDGEPLGGMSYVFFTKAELMSSEQRALGRKTAVRVLKFWRFKQEPEKHPDLARLWAQENRITNALQGTGLMPDWRGSDQKPQSDIPPAYIETQYEPGMTLREFIAVEKKKKEKDPRYQTPEDIVIGVIAEMIEKTNAFHAKDRIHRDFKPGNLFFTLRKGLLFLDPGIAKKPGDDEAEAILGTRKYMPDEQLEGKTGLTTFKADVAALGRILLEDLCDLLPQKSNVRARLEKFAQEQMTLKVDQRCSMQDVMNEMHDLFGPQLPRLRRFTDKELPMENDEAFIDMSGEELMAKYLELYPKRSWAERRIDGLRKNARAAAAITVTGVALVAAGAAGLALHKSGGKQPDTGQVVPEKKTTLTKVNQGLHILSEGVEGKMHVKEVIFHPDSPHALAFPADRLVIVETESGKLVSCAGTLSEDELIKYYKVKDKNELPPDIRKGAQFFLHVFEDNEFRFVPSGGYEYNVGTRRLFAPAFNELDPKGNIWKFGQDPSSIVKKKEGFDIGPLRSLFLDMDMYMFLSNITTILEKRTDLRKGGSIYVGEPPKDLPPEKQQEWIQKETARICNQLSFGIERHINRTFKNVRELKFGADPKKNP